MSDRLTMQKTIEITKSQNPICGHETERRAGRERRNQQLENRPDDLTGAVSVPALTALVAATGEIVGGRLDTKKSSDSVLKEVPCPLR